MLLSGQVASRKSHITPKEEPGQISLYTQWTRCGYSKHKGQKCLASTATCHKCNRRGHFSAKCFSKTVALVTSTEEGGLETAFLNVMSSQQGTPWISSIQLEGKTVRFKLDTGADVTAISTEAHQHIGGTTLSPPSKALYGPARQTLNVLGQFPGTLRFGENTSQETIFVVEGLRTNLLGLQAITSLRMIRRICNMTAEEELFERFPKVFNGLGTIGKEYAERQHNSLRSSCTSEHSDTTPTKGETRTGTYGTDGCSLGSYGTQ